MTEPVHVLASYPEAASPLFAVCFPGGTRKACMATQWAIFAPRESAMRQTSVMMTLPSSKVGRALRRTCRAIGITAVLAATNSMPGSSEAQVTPTPTSDQAPTANPATGPVGPVRAPGGPFLADRYGRVVLMHGVDLVYKVPPFEVVVNGTGPNVLTPSEAQRMAGLGFDVVRLGIIWKGLEPGTRRSTIRRSATPGTPRTSGPGQFDPSVFNGYLRALDATIALLGRYGIYSLIDMHQDVYNEVFGGEGAPDWAVCTNGAKPRSPS